MTRQYSSVAADTTLTAGITGPATSIVVVSVAGFPITYPYTLSIDADAGTKELVEVTNAVGTTLTVTRGVDGTSAVSHGLGAVVRHDHSARDFRESREHEAAVADVHGVSGQLVGANSTQTLTNKNMADASNVFPANFVLTTASQTLTNKNLTSGTNTFPSSLATLTGTQTLTNKDLTSGTNTFPSSFVTLTGTQTLTNKTLTAPVLTGAVDTSGATFAGMTITDPSLVLKGSKSNADSPRSISYDATTKQLFVKDAAATVAGWSGFSPDVVVADKTTLDAITNLPAGKHAWVTAELATYVWNGTAWRKSIGSVATKTDLTGLPTAFTGQPVWVIDQAAYYVWNGSAWTITTQARIMAKSKPTTQSIVPSTSTQWVDVTWGENTYDSGSAFTATGAEFTYVGPMKAFIYIDGYIEWQSNDTNDRLVRIMRSTDAGVSYSQWMVFTNARVRTQLFFGHSFANPGYKFKVQVSNEHTASLNIGGSSSGTRVSFTAVPSGD